MDFRILGPVEVHGDDGPIRLGGAKHRALLAALLLNANEVVSADRLVDELWDGQPPNTADNALQVYVSQLRKALGPAAALRWHPPGYVLEIAPDELDAARFERLAEAGRRALAAGEADEAARHLRDALALWRGPALCDAMLASAVAEARRLEDARVAALEDRLEADLALGRDAELVAELEALVAEHPLRERLRAQLMRALYRAGRQAEALSAYQAARRALVDELGIEPSPPLQDLERAILNQDSSLATPPVAPAPPRRPARRLPVAPTPLVGREREVERVVALARRDDVRLVTFTGAGGIGKTRLALETARALAVEYPDGAVFVPLALVGDPALVEPTIATSLGLVADGEPEREALRAYLRDRSMLLVLDNFEQVVGAAPALADLLADAPEVKLFVTSREVLRLSGEHEFPVGPLALPPPGGSPADSPAVALFVQRASASVPDFQLDGNAQAVADLCARLEGIPLAIELAAARSKLLPPQTMLARLSSRLDLPAAAARDVPARHQTLRATIDWSHDLLSSAEQILFRRLAIFSGTFELGAAEQVAGADLDPLQSLVDKSLVTREGREEPRFAMLELVREYALERLAASGDADDVARRHLAHYLELAATAEKQLVGEAQANWLERLEQEHGNLRAAIAFALESGDGASAVRLVAALRRFWQIHGHLAEGRRLTEAALAVAPDDPSSERAKALNGVGIFAGEQGDYAAARTFFQESLALARDLGDRDREAAAASNLANLALLEGRAEEALPRYAEVAKIWTELGRRRGLSIVNENIASAALRVGDLDRALEAAEESVSLARETRDSHQLASALEAFAQVLFMRGDHVPAAGALRESLETAGELGELHAEANCVDGFAALAAAAGRYEDSARLIGAADALRESIGARRSADQQHWYDAAITAKAELGERRFAEAYAAGRRADARALPFGDAA